MYVCVCNAITDRDLAGLAREGVRSAAEAYRRLGGTPVCGRCLDFAQSVIDDADAPAERRMAQVPGLQQATP